jgi:predicted nucleic acid-binding Zn ribbon protein
MMSPAKFAVQGPILRGTCLAMVCRMTTLLMPAPEPAPRPSLPRLPKGLSTVEVPPAAPARPLPGFHGAVSDFKRRLLEATLTQAGGNRTRAARALGLQRTYLLGYCPADEFVGSVFRGHGGRGVRRRLTDALPDQHDRGLRDSPQVSPRSARALVEGSPANADGRLCPVCDKPLRTRQRVCSGRCRAELSRRRQAEARQARDEQVRALLLAALALMGKNEQL